MVNINIEIISDIVCVWCFIGKRSLEKAIGLYQKTYPGGKNDVFNITWRPYYLDYTRFISTEQSVDKAEVSKVKFQNVSTEKMTAMKNRVDQIARANGIEFNSRGKIGSTRDAHSLIHFSQQNASPTVQDAVVENLFQAYHEKAMDISEQSVLQQIALEAGLNEPEVERWLVSSHEKELIDREAQENRAIAVTGVPTFIIQGRYRVDGAQDIQEFFETFVKVRESSERA